MPDLCACRDYCGDIPEDKDRPGSVCKLRPSRSGGAVVEVALVDRRDVCAICGAGPTGRCEPPDDYEGECPHGCSPER